MDDNVTAFAAATEQPDGSAHGPIPLGGLLDHLAIGVFRCSADWRLLAASDSFARLLGYPSAAELTRDVVDLEADLPVLLRRADPFADAPDRDDGVRNFNLLVRRHDDGEKRWIAVFLRPVRDRTGALLYSEGVVKDVTERRNAEAAVARSERRLRDFADVSADWFWELDRDLRVTHVSPGARKESDDVRYRFVGRTPREIVGGTRGFEDWEPCLRAIEEHEPVAAYGLRVAMPSGGTVWVEARGKPCFDDDGTFSGYRGSFRDISPIVESQHELRDSEERFRRLAAVTQEAVCIFENERIVDANLAFATLFGYRPAELPGRHLGEFLAPQVGGALPLVLSEILNGDSTETIGIRRDGQNIPIELRGRSMPFGGRVVRALSVRDLTRLRHVEESLREREELLRKVLSLVPYSIFWKNRDLVYLGCNDVCARELGLDDPAAVVGRSDDELETDPVLRAEWRELARICLEGRPVYEHEFERRDPDGSVRTFLLSKAPIHDRQGRVVGLVGVIADVTERTLAEDALRESEERYRKISEIASDLMYSYRYDADGSVQFEWLAGSISDLDGESEQDHFRAGDWLSLVHPDDHEIALRRREKLQAGIPSVDEFRVVLPRGGVRWLRARGDPQRDDEGRIQRVIGAAEDITAEKNAEAALRKAKDLAEAANNAKTRFLAAASHDLRQPVQAALLFADALGGMLERPGDRSALARLRSALGDVEGLLEALLDISRFEADLIRADMRVVDLGAIIYRLALEFRPQFQRRGITLDVVRSSVSVIADPNLLANILRNLLANALRYTERGRVLFGVRRRADACVDIEVWDTGPGIPEDQREAIFEEFRQLGNEGRDKSQGLGLGLSIARRTALLMGHGIGLRTWPGTGSVFALTHVALAPSQSRSRASAPAAPDVPPARLPKQALAGRRIMIIDDNRPVLEATGVTLGNLGAEPILCESLDEAVVALAGPGGPPEAIIADYRLGDELTGAEAVDVLEAMSGRDFPSLLVTGDIAPARLVAASASGRRMLNKPVSAETLGKAVIDLLAARRRVPASGAAGR
ncbi:PAS domain S-box protein [Oceanibacterium hippocampi]|uniref:histidine kinase n=1 Tax=Oceanibacterium hippocampi TaxID=745714 RepID=A0A1Y5SB52_9PROT|nr:PAS domain S-box protein [Oceanibacterium hippocampi]SLN36750.1 Virulence sensor protein BvgS precursor [Oceanibacterium hippocampi]